MKSLIFNIHDVITLIVLVEILFLCIVLKKFSNRNKESHNALIVLFMAVACAKAGSLLVWNDYLQTVWDTSVTPALLTVGLLLEGPALLAYLHTTARGSSLNRVHVFLHLIPSLVAVSLIFSFNITNQDWLPKNWLSLSPEKYAALQFVWLLFKCVPLLYIGMCWYVEFQIREKMKDVLSSISQIDIRLVDIILAGFLAHWLWSFVGYALSGYLIEAHNDMIGVINDYFVILLVNVLFVFCLVSGRELLIDQADVKAIASDAEEPVHDLTKLSLIRNTIDEKKPYLDSRLNLDRFSEMCGMRSREVSLLINSQFRKNFYEFINELRVEEAKRLLLIDKHKAVLEVAMDSGFNSYSAFQRFFKRFSGMSPSDYRKLNLD